MKAPDFSINRYLSTSTGKKFLMALSGAAMVGFIFAHLAGNLQIFEGQEAINRYALFLKNLGELLWVARIGLILMILIHIKMSIQLTLENNAARPVAYAEKNYTAASTASRTMIWSGVVILAFIIFHLLHYTFMVVHPQYRNLVDAQGRHDVYSMMVLGFQQPAISLFYIVAIFLLCFHLSHGLYSMFQSLGLQNKKFRDWLLTWAPRIAWLIFLGYASIPSAVLTGLVKLPPGVTP
jgi:succinate dehydrogenase / fumarate reductase cytochrome b subunit